MFRIIVVAFALAGFAQQAQSQTEAQTDAQTIQACVSAKAGPEGDLPPDGPVRARLLKEMEGGVQACVGALQAACAASGGDADACRARESRAWLDALKLEPDAGGKAKNRAIWAGAAARIRGQAIALCEGAAAVSAWGGDTVARRGRYGMSLSSECVRDAIAQQALVMLVNARGN